MTAYPAITAFLLASHRKEWMAGDDIATDDDLDRACDAEEAAADALARAVPASAEDREAFRILIAHLVERDEWPGLVEALRARLPVFSTERGS